MNNQSQKTDTLLDEEIKRLKNKYTHIKARWDLDDISLQLPTPTPASLSLLKKVYGLDGPYHNALRALGLKCSAKKIDYLLETICGRLATNKAIAIEMNKRGLFDLIGLFKDSRLVITSKKKLIDNSCELVKKLEIIIKENEYYEPANEIEKNINGLKKMIDSLLEEYEPVFIISILSDINFKMAQKSLHFIGKDKFNALLTSPLSEFLPTENQLNPGPNLLNIMSQSGHRSPTDWELFEPRYNEQGDYPQFFKEYQNRQLPDFWDSYNGLTKEFFKETLRPVLASFFARDVAKHVLSLYLNNIRKNLLAIGSQSGFHDLIFFLDLNEIDSLEDKKDYYYELASNRKDKLNELLKTDVSFPITKKSLSSIGHQIKDSYYLNKGKTVYPGTIEGRVKVITNSDYKDVCSGDIIVMERIGSDILFAIEKGVAGVIVENGGLLSHPAILLREYKTPSIFGLKDATKVLTNNDTIILDSKKGEVLIKK
jgi:phosphohistidine swiveling domain-containing protein